VQHALHLVSQNYARLLLLCSNFESSLSDQSFFECLYFFSALSVKMSLANAADDERVDALVGGLFRAGFWQASTRPMQQQREQERKSMTYQKGKHPRDVAFVDLDGGHVNSKAGGSPRAASHSSPRASAPPSKKGGRAPVRKSRYKSALPVDAPVEQHEARASLVSSLVIQNISAAAELRSWVTGGERNGELKRNKRGVVNARDNSWAVGTLVGPQGEKLPKEKASPRAGMVAAATPPKKKGLLS
jgi:hypothetical protein